MVLFRFIFNSERKRRSGVFREQKIIWIFPRCFDFGERGGEKVSVVGSFDLGG